MFNPTTKGDIGKILSESDSERIQLVCPKHNYLGGKIPPETSGCKDCWLAYYTWDLATTPPSKRQERLEELEVVIHHMVEYEQKGQFGSDLELYRPGDPRFEVKIEKDGEPDNPKRPCKQCGKLVDFSEPYCVHETQEESAWRNQ